jgi:hypothetical protein
MLPGEQGLPEAIFALDGQIVNRLFAALSREADQRLGCSLKEQLQILQIAWFGKHRQNLYCPSCSSQALIRKGWRERKLKTSRGSFRLLVLQVRCQNCGRSFRPWNDRLGLPSSRRILEELEIKAVFLATQVSFARSATIIKRLTGGKVSAEGIRQKIAEQSKKIQLPTPQKGETVLVDSTKVKAGSKERGVPVYLAVTAQPGPYQSNRATCNKQLLHIHVGVAEPLKNHLRQLMPDYLVHDGGDNLEDCAKHVQRCRWHLGYQLKHYLWQDGIPHNFRPPFHEALMDIMSDRENGPQRYLILASNLATCGLKTTAGHLLNAAAEAFTFRKEPGFSYIDTSPLEREMREINRRTDIGARWSRSGIENVLKVLLHQRLNNNSRGQT